MANENQNAKVTRVLLVAPSFDILGGQSVQAARLMERLEQETSLSVGFLPINPRLPGPFRQLQKIKYVRTLVTSVAYLMTLLLRLWKYDVIHVFSASYFSFLIAPTPAILVAKLYGRKVLLNYHSGEAEDHLQRWRRTAIPTLRLADVVVVPSEYLVEVFAKFGLTAYPINNLIDIAHFPFRQRVPLRPIFLSNRNLEKHYGVHTVLQAFGIIQKRIPEATLIVVGDGSQRQVLESLALELGLKHTSFRGRVDPTIIATVYDAADIYLNGSEIDNQPLSLLEAFACGIPIVTTDVGGIPYIVADGVNGMLVPPGDSALLAERAMQLLNDSGLAAQLIEQGRSECRKYSWDFVRDAWIDTYRKLTTQRGETKVEISEATEEKIATR